MMMMRVNGDKKKKVKKTQTNNSTENQPKISDLWPTGLLVASLQLQAGEKVPLLVSSELLSVQGLFLLGDLCGSEMKARLNGF